MSFRKYVDKARDQVERYTGPLPGSSHQPRPPPPPPPPPQQYHQQQPPPPQQYYPGGPGPPPPLPAGYPGAGPGPRPPPVPPHPAQDQQQQQQQPFYWRPVFSPAEPVSRNFEHRLGDHGWGNNEAQNYTDAPANSFHSPAGALVLRAVADARAPRGRQYTSARLVSRQTLARDRGCLEVRVSAPSAPGVWPAFWLLPREPFAWPQDGEVDIMESWNAARVNHCCLHWGHFNGDHWDRHRVRELDCPDLDSPRGKTYAFAWAQHDPAGPSGRLLWYIDGRPVMRAEIPPGTRPLHDWQVIINIAMGGNVNQGVIPADGVYEMTIHSLKFCEEPAGGWVNFDRDFVATPEGHTM